MKGEKLPLKITLSVIAYAPKMSEETYCFKADVLVDGKLVAHATNQGHGGNTNVQPYSGTGKVTKAWEQLVAHCDALPKQPIMLETSDKGEPMPLTNEDGSVVLVAQNVESVVDDLFNNYVRDVYIPKVEHAKYKRKCTTKTIYRLKSDPGMDWEMNQLYSPGLKTHLQAKHGADLEEIINERFIDKPVISSPTSKRKRHAA